MRSVWDLGGLNVRHLTRRVVNEAWADDVFGQAAKLSYFFVLAVFPLLLFVLALLSVTGTGDDILHGLLSYWRRVLPHAAYDLVARTLGEIRAKGGSGKLSIGLIGWIWAASSGMSAFMDGMNRAYDVVEGRPWWKARLLAVVLTIALAIFIIVSLSIVLYGSRLGELAATNLGAREFFDGVWVWLQWPVALGFLLLAFVLLYRFAPDLRGLTWTRTMPGAMMAIVLWLAVSFGFRMYLRFFNSYGATYGSLGAMIILMLWFYLTGAAVLIGAEINSEIEHAAAEAGEHGARLPGEKAPGERAAKRHGRRHA